MQKRKTLTLNNNRKPKATLTQLKALYTPLEEKKPKPKPRPKPQQESWKSKERVTRCKSWLYTIPLFKNYQPLAIGIDKVLLKIRPKGVTTRVLKYVLSCHCNSKRYLNVMVEGGSRFDVDGKEAGAITDKQVEKAKAMLHAKKKPKKKNTPQAK